MKRVRTEQVTVSLTTGNSEMEEKIPHFEGMLLGYTSKLVGTLETDTTLDVGLKKSDGQVIGDFIDQAYSEITTKRSIKDAMVPTPLMRPGSIKAVALPSATLGSGVDYSVKFTIWYVEGTNEEVSISECF